jgi:hypothetical protein
VIQETSFNDFCRVVDPHSLYAVLPKSNLNASQEPGSGYSFSLIMKKVTSKKVLILSIVRVVSEAYLFVRKGKLLVRWMAKLLKGTQA